MGHIYALYRYKKIVYIVYKIKKNIYNIYKNTIPIISEKTILIHLRDYIVAPIIEEVMFRCILITILQKYTISNINSIFITSFYFSISHVIYAILHDYNIDFLILQFIYTFLFGTIASWMYLCTYSLYPSCFAHILCNLFGIPIFHNSSLGIISHIIGIIMFFLFIYIFQINA